MKPIFNMKQKFKKILALSLSISLSIALTFSMGFNSFAESSFAGQEKRTQVLFLADIIEDDLNMNDLITRRDFARMVAKACPFKDSVTDTAVSSAYTDVSMYDKNASYIKLVGQYNYMSTYLGGQFRPDDGLTYKELIRTCLALLGYTNEDFATDQVNGRFQKFCNLEMNEYITRDQKDLVTKKDCVNAIYNMLKCKQKSGGVYGTEIFNMTTDGKGDLNASGLLKTKMQGPFLLKVNQNISSIVPFEIENANLFVNGYASTYNVISKSLGESGYMIVYYNVPTKTVYCYQEGTTPDSTTYVKVGYVDAIYYNGTDMLTPTSVDIDRTRYSLGNSDVKMAFSYAGTIHVDDRVVIVLEKTNEAMYGAGTGDEDYDPEEDVGIKHGGTIVNAFLYSIVY